MGIEPMRFDEVAVSKETILTSAPPAYTKIYAFTLIHVFIWRTRLYYSSTQGTMAPRCSTFYKKYEFKENQ